MALAAVSITSPAAGGESPSLADAVRGGWVTDIDGTRHIFILKVLDGAVTGVYCAVDCRDPANLAFVDQGTLTADGLRFQILQVDGRRQVRTDVTGRVDGERLALSLDSRKGSAIPRQLTLQRDPRKPAARTAEALFKSRGVQSGPLVIAASSTPYVAPGPNEQLSPAIIEGLWVWGTGSGKQHFMFKRVGDQLLGAVCGPCDNPWTFGPLDNIAIHGDTVTFDIVHEDWGIGIEHGPFANHATATLSHHELHLLTTQQNGPHTIKGDMVLAGPLRTPNR